MSHLDMRHLSVVVAEQVQTPTRFPILISDPGGTSCSSRSELASDTDRGWARAKHFVSDRPGCLVEFVGTIFELERQ